MTSRLKNSFVRYFILVIVVLLVFAGIIYWTLPLVVDRRAKEVPIGPDQPESKLKVLNPPANASAPEVENIPQMVARVGSAVVKITTVKERVFYDFFYGQSQEQVTGEGSGVIIDEQGYILTNNHVVEDVDQITVLLTDRSKKEREMEGQVLGRDPVTDLAVVKISGENLLVAPLGNSDQLKVGETAVAIGNPYGFSSTVTAGVISALNRDLPIQEGTELLDLIQTDAAINPGNSGGALFNIQGEVVGINTVMIQGAQGLGFAIPINIAKDISKELIENGYVKRPWLGIFGTTVTPNLVQKFDLETDKGVLISKVVPDSPGEQAGIRPKDVLIEIAGVEISTMEQLVRELRNHEIGDEVSLVVLRDGKKRELKLKLQERPQELAG